MALRIVGGSESKSPFVRAKKSIPTLDLYHSKNLKSPGIRILIPSAVCHDAGIEFKSRVETWVDEEAHQFGIIVDKNGRLSVVGQSAKKRKRPTQSSAALSVRGSINHDTLEYLKRHSWEYLKFDLVDGKPVIRFKGDPRGTTTPRVPKTRS